MLCPTLRFSSYRRTDRRKPTIKLTHTLLMLIKCMYIATLIYFFFFFFARMNAHAYSMHVHAHSHTHRHRHTHTHRHTDTHTHTHTQSTLTLSAPHTEQTYLQPTKDVWQHLKLFELHPKCEQHRWQTDRQTETSASNYPRKAQKHKEDTEVSFTKQQLQTEDTDKHKSIIYRVKWVRHHGQTAGRYTHCSHRNIPNHTAISMTARVCIKHRPTKT